MQFKTFKEIYVFAVALEQDILEFGRSGLEPDVPRHNAPFPTNWVQLTK